MDIDDAQLQQIIRRTRQRIASAHFEPWLLSESSDYRDYGGWATSWAAGCYHTRRLWLQFSFYSLREHYGLKVRFCVSPGGNALGTGSTKLEDRHLEELFEQHAMRSPKFLNAWLRPVGSEIEQPTLD